MSKLNLISTPMVNISGEVVDTLLKAPEIAKILNVETSTTLESEGVLGLQESQ